MRLGDLLTKGNLDPIPLSFVSNGSNTWPTMSEEIPFPLSATCTSTAALSWTLQTHGTICYISGRINGIVYEPEKYLLDLSRIRHHDRSDPNLTPM
jgi:hypothetical protein